MPISTVFTFVWFSFLINCGLKKSPQPSLHAISRKWKEAVLRNTQFSLWCQKKSSDRRKLVTIFFWPRSHHCLTQRSSHGRPCITTHADVWAKTSQNYYLRAKRSVHSSANLFFHFSNKNGKGTYYLSLSYLHISKHRKKAKKRKWSGKSIIFSFF